MAVLLNWINSFFGLVRMSDLNCLLMFETTVLDQNGSQRTEAFLLLFYQIAFHLRLALAWLYNHLRDGGNLLHILPP